MAGKASKRKGQAGERQLVAWFQDMGIRAERVPGSGAFDYHGEKHDVNAYPAGECMTIECKRRKAPMKTLDAWQGGADVLAVRIDRGDWFFRVRENYWRKLMARLVQQDKRIRELEGNTGT